MDVFKIIIFVSAAFIVSGCDTNNYSSTDSNTSDEAASDEAAPDEVASGDVPEGIDESEQTGIFVSDGFFITFSDGQPKVFNENGFYRRTTITVTANADDVNDLIQTNFNTPVNFRTEWGSFDTDQCFIGSEGTCSVEWTSGDPRHFQSVCSNAFTIFTSGEESFIDANDDGLFNFDESFTDLEEPFLDVNGNGSFDASGLELIDLAVFSSGTKNGIHDFSDNRYNGSLCDSPSTNAECSNRTSTIIWNKARINVKESNDGLDEIADTADDFVCIKS